MSRTAISQTLPEFVIHYGNASGIRPCHCDHQAVLEVGLWMSARIPITDLSIDKRHLLERELADVIPLLPIADLVEIATLLEDQAPHIVRCWLVGVELKAQCRSQRRGTRANIGDIVAAPVFDVQD